MKSTAIALFALLCLSFGHAFALGGSTCATATVVGALPYSDGGQLESGFDPNCPGDPANDLFYVFTAPYTSTFRFDMCGSNSCCFQQMRLWTDGTCCSGASVTANSGCVDGYPQYDLAMSSGQVVYIEVGKSGGEWAIAPLYQFNVTGQGVPNDTCPGAVIPALPYTDNGSTTAATHQYTGSCYTQSAPDVVYQFTSPSLVFLRASLVAAWFDCMQVRKNNCAIGASLQCDFGAGADSSWFYILAEPDSTYYFIVDGAYDSDFGPYTFNLLELPVPNDSCPGAVIPALPYTDNSTTEFSSLQYGGNCYYFNGPDVVYQYTPPDSVVLRASLVGPWNTCMQVRKNNCATGYSLQCDCDYGSGTWFTFLAEADSSYYFIVDGAFETDFGPYTFAVQESPVQNDICPGTVIPALPYLDNGSTAEATHQYVDGFCYTQLAPDVVYQYTSPDSLILRASLVAAWTDGMQVRKNNCETGASLVCDFGSGADSSWFSFLAEPDSTYYFIVGGYLSVDLGSYAFTLQEIPFVQGDLCPGTVIPALPYTDNGSTAEASHQYVDGICYTQSAPDFVYQYTSPDSVTLSVSLVASWWDCMQMRRNNCETGTVLQCDCGSEADSSWFNFLAEADSTYYFIVDGFSDTDLGPYSFTLQESPIQNDVCPGTVITALPYTDNSSTAAATHQYTGSCYTESAPDVVYQYTSPNSVVLRASMSAAWFDCMQVRKNNCATGASLQCDFGAGADSSWFDFVAEPDSSYYFIVDGAYNWDYGDYTFTLQESPVQVDICPGTVIPALPYSDNGSTAAYSNQYVGSCYVDTAPDVVYQYTAPDSVFLGASLAASWHDCIQVRKNNCATGASLRCDIGFGADSSEIAFWAEPDSTYYFIVDGLFDTELGAYTFALHELPVPIEGDLCPGIVIPTLPYADNGSTAAATHQYEGNCYGTSTPDVVYQYRSPDSAALRASLVATWSHQMHVRKNNCETGASLLCGGALGGDTLWFNFLAEPDSTYYFIVDGSYFTEFGPYTFALICPTCCPAPDSLVIQKSGANALLTWPPVACSSPTYSIYRSATLPVQPIPANLIGTTTGTTYTDPGILSNPALKFFYAVTASTP